MKRAGIHIAIWFAASIVALSFAVSPTAESATISVVVDHAVLPGPDANPLPDRPVAVVTAKRRVILRIDNTSQGLASIDRLMPERRTQYRTPDSSADLFSLNVFIVYLPRDPPVA